MAAVTAGVVAAAAAAASAGYAISQGSGGDNAANAKPPNYSKQMAKGIATESSLLPEKVRGELAARNQFDIPALMQTLGYMNASNAGVNQMRLDAADTYVPREIEQRRTFLDISDPGKLAARDKVGQMVLDELSKGRELSPEQELGLKDAIRGRQVASGITDGTMPVLDEGLAMMRYKDETRSRRLSEAGSFLAMPSLAEMSQGMPTGFTPMQNTDSFRLFDPRAGQSAADFSQRSYATQAGIQPQPNGWMQGLGMIAGGAARYAGWASTRPTPPVQQGTSGATNSWINI